MQNCSTDEDESKGIIVNECSTEEDESECGIIKQKDANNEIEYDESSVTNDVPSYFNVFECGRKILDRLDLLYEQACMATPKEEYYTKMLETLVNYNDCNSGQFSNKKI